MNRFGSAVRISRKSWAEINRRRKLAPKKANPFAPYKNKWEAEYAGILAAEQLDGKWAAVRYEPASFVVIPQTEYQRRVAYTPDFMLIDPQGRLSFIEVKGHMRKQDQLRMKAFRAIMPNVVRIYLVGKDKGSWCAIPF